MGRPVFDLTGQVFGRLTVLEYIGSSRWRSRCSCGNETTPVTSSLRSGATQSCGCLALEAKSAVGRANRRHGHAQRHEMTRTYKSWISMRQRCRNANAPNFASYGGRGIAVCARWDSFELFLADMGPRPEGMSIDRIDVDGNYEPGNCRWATPKQQQANRRCSPARRLEVLTTTMTWDATLDAALPVAQKWLASLTETYRPRRAA